MSRIVLISCVKLKRQTKSKVRDLYISALFKKSFAYAEHYLQPDKILVLSAKHGLLDLDTEIEPYDATLNNMSAKERKKWAEKVIQQLQIQTDLANDQFIFLASNRYIQYLIPRIAHYELPLKGLGIGKQLNLLNERLIALGIGERKPAPKSAKMTESAATTAQTTESVDNMESIDQTDTVYSESIH